MAFFSGISGVMFPSPLDVFAAGYVPELASVWTGLLHAGEGRRTTTAAARKERFIVEL